VLVSAAASLTDAFEAVAAGFEATHPDIDVALNFGGSSALKEQILDGAPVDVFASANASTMSQVVAAGDAAGQPAVFARNTLEIAVPPGNPGKVGGLADFDRAELLIGLCAEGVPCGDFARHALREAGVVPSIDTNEPDVRSLLTKIEAGELDAGIVYATDIASAGGEVEGIDIPADQNVVAEYPIVVLAGAPNLEAARAFVAFVLSDPGRTILAGYGFGLP
jgi:molybdate transport system substrate-binding protein